MRQEQVFDHFRQESRHRWMARIRNPNVDNVRDDISFTVDQKNACNDGQEEKHQERVRH